MKNPIIIFTKLLGKGIAVLLLSALSIFSWAFNILFFFYRLIAVAFAAIGTALNTVNCFQHGFTAERGLIFLFLVCIVALRYVLPLLVPVIQQWHSKLELYIREPITNRSPVRYTI